MSPHRPASQHHHPQHLLILLPLTSPHLASRGDGGAKAIRGRVARTSSETWLVVDVHQVLERGDVEAFGAHQERCKAKVVAE